MEPYKGGKHDLRARWATNGVGSEVHMSFACGWDAVLYVQHVPTGQACFGDEWRVFAHLYLLSIVTRWRGGEEMDSREQDCPALALCTADPPKGGSLGAMVSHSLEEWPVSITRSWGPR